MRVSDDQLRMVRSSAVFDSERVGAPGSQVRLIADWTIAALAELLRLRAALVAVEKRGCERGSPGVCSERHPCGPCVARYALAGYDIANPEAS